MIRSRDRVTFGNEALFVSPTATGFHYTGRNGIGLKTPARKPTDMGGWQCSNAWPPFNPYGSDPAYASGQGTAIKQLKRVQSISYGFNANLTDVNQYGNLSRLSSISVEEPLVNLEFSYYLLDGFNERHLGLVIDGTKSPLEQEVSGSEGRNYFIETVPQGRSVVGGDASIPDSLKTVVSIGNGFVTSYSASMAINSIPTATVSVEAYNIKADIGATGLNIPGLNLTNGSLVSDAWLNNEKGVCDPAGCTGLFSVPAATSAYSPCEDVSALRPGDIVLNLANAALISRQVAGNSRPEWGTALIESATINLPLNRSSLRSVGNAYGFSKSLDFPIEVTVDIEASVSEIKKSRLVELLCACEGHDLLITIYDPSCAACDRDMSSVAISYKITNAILESENFSSNIGDNKTVSLQFSTQLET